MSDGNIRITRKGRLPGKRINPPGDIPCFNKPAGVTDRDFMEQLLEQEDAINNTDIAELIQRRDMVKQMGTGALRDRGAQTTARTKWTSSKVRELLAAGMSPSKAKQAAAKEAANLDATHVLDIVAGGHASELSGLQNSSVNRSIGSQWRNRVDTLDEALADHAVQGGVKANVRLKKC
ncbi:polymorphic toxin type 15 domain-containing protein [uncultured Litoreibacter sp.]|uniref:polymorphic toxin type 15 domain-containing protein n=1 Tax=uncultured Litoreibacter sp. TaxID=1392394 RepID=UPI002632CCD1|nr:polymorphic toxin type 15 domain-containing protein [uncultured Litoreibacter sp.]